MNEYRKSLTGHHQARGATAVEYALIIGLIAAVIIVTVNQLSTKTEGLYNQTNTEMVNNGL